jgi:chaperonin GroES
MLLRLPGFAAGVPAQETQVAAEYRGPKPLRRCVTGLCEGRLALVHRDCQSSNNHKSPIITKAKEDRMKFRPLHDRVVVKRIDAEDKTAGGIIIPDSAKEKPSQGEITAVGPGGRDEAGKLIPIDLEVGDRVLFGKWSGTEVKLDGQELLIMKESDIMGVLTDLPVATKKAA